MIQLTPEFLLAAYAAGIFPMAESADDPELFWVDPRRRGILPLDAFHVSRRLRRVVRQRPFRDPLRQCLRRSHPRLRRGERKTAEHLDQRRDRAALRGALRPRRGAQRRSAGRAASWSGGLYGVSLGAAFFGESMFSRDSDASKVALVHLVARLRLGGYRLLDTQFLTPHLARFGGIEISRARYRRLLAEALVLPRVLSRRLPGGAGGDPLAALQSSRLTS